MDEKKKKSTTKFPVWRILVYLGLTILAIPILCGVFIGVLMLFDYVQVRQCFDEGDVLEWNGLLEFPSPETVIPISQSNVSRLSLLPYIDPGVFPEIHYNTAISHPQHSYFLSRNWSEFGLYPPDYLVLCQPNGWASHVLSSNVSQYRFSPDGSLLSLISNQNTIELYNADTIELINVLEFPEWNYIRYYALHPTEPLIAFIASESHIDSGRLYIWNYETQEELAVIIDYRGFDRVDFLAFNVVGTFLIMRVIRPEPEILVWGIPPE